MTFEGEAYHEHVHTDVCVDCNCFTTIVPKHPVLYRLRGLVDQHLGQSLRTQKTQTQLGGGSRERERERERESKQLRQGLKETNYEFDPSIPQRHSSVNWRIKICTHCKQVIYDYLPFLCIFPLL